MSTGYYSDLKELASVAIPLQEGICSCWEQILSFKEERREWFPLKKEPKLSV